MRHVTIGGIGASVRVLVQGQDQDLVIAELRRAWSRALAPHGQLRGAPVHASLLPDQNTQRGGTRVVSPNLKQLLQALLQSSAACAPKRTDLPPITQSALADGWIDQFGDDFLGSVVRDLFNRHAALGGDDHRHALAGAISDRRYVIFFFDVGTVFDQESADFLTHRAGLVRDQLHAQNLTSKFLDIVNRACQLDPAPLATSTCMNLRFDNPNRAAEFLGGFDRLLNGECSNAARHWHTKLTQDFLALVLVNLHEGSLRSG